jgi:hypothetical protein
VRLGHVNTSDYVHEIQLVGQFAYLVTGAGAGHLEIVDVSQPDQPKLVGSLTFDSSAAGVRVVRDIAYVAATFGGLQVVDVSNPAVPVLVGSIDTIGAASGVDVVGDLAYVAATSAGLQVVEVQLLPASVGLPHLQIRRSGQQLELSWPAGRPGVKLQRRASFAPEHSWQDVPANLTEADGITRVIVDTAGASGYFRLLTP